MEKARVGVKCAVMQGIVTTRKEVEFDRKVKVEYKKDQQDITAAASASGKGGAAPWKKILVGGEGDTGEMKEVYVLSKATPKVRVESRPTSRKNSSAVPSAATALLVLSKTVGLRKKSGSDEADVRDDVEGMGSETVLARGAVGIIRSEPIAALASSLNAGEGWEDQEEEGEGGSSSEADSVEEDT